LRIVEALLEEGAALRLHDPKAMPLLKKVLPAQTDRLTYCDSPYSAASDAQALLILTEWPEYRELDWAKIRSLMDIPMVIDGRNLLDPADIRRAGFEYISMGRPELG
jgi:UDPglucose 6-dehydrogenase